GHVDVVNILLQNSATIDSREALHLALGHKCSLIRLLVDHGADVNAWDKDGISVLHVAAQKGASEIVEFLLSKGA
ncbi:ankyrin, partial [Zopfia rhizophila CBS 207.26]